MYIRYIMLCLERKEYQNGYIKIKKVEIEWR
jgi:hypothetical protein